MLHVLIFFFKMMTLESISLKVLVTIINCSFDKMISDMKGLTENPRICLFVEEVALQA